MTIDAHDAVPSASLPDRIRSAGTVQPGEVPHQELGFSAKMTDMSEPTAPDSQPEIEPDTEPDAAPEIEPDAAPDAAADDLTGSADPDPEPAVDPVAAEATSKSNQVIAIVAAVVIVVIVGVVAAFSFLGGDDKAKTLSPEDQAKAAAVAMFEGIYKVARGDVAGCQELVDNLALTPEQGNFFNDCVAKIPTETAAASAVVLDSVKPTQVTLDEAAGKGTVLVDVSTTENGKSETQPASVPVLKVDGHWKVDLNSNPAP